MESFFYAGANSLMVSQWPVASYSTVELTTKMMKIYMNEPSFSKSDALRESMIEMINGDNNFYHHPFFWSPFILVGSN